MAIARDHLRRHVLALQPQPLHHPRLDRGGHRGVGADRAGELAEGELLEGVFEPRQVAVGLKGEAGEAQAEGRRLGVDAVGAADAEGVAVLQRLLDQGVAIGAGACQHHLACFAQLQRQGRVEHVGGGQPVVDPAAVLADRSGDDVDEGGDIVVGHLLALVDGLDRERRVCSRRLRRLARHGALLGPGLRRRQLDLKPALELALRGPSSRSLAACIGDQSRPPFGRVAWGRGSRTRSPAAPPISHDRTRPPGGLRSCVDDPRGQDPGVFRPVDRDAGDRDSGRHLHGGEQRVETPE